MSYQDFDAFRSSNHCRKTSKKTRLNLSLTGDRMAPPENFYSDRRKGTSAVARVIFIIVLLHVLIVGGTFLHKKLQADKEPTADSSLVPPPSNAAPAPATITPLPEPKPEVAQTVPTNTITPPTLPVLPASTTSAPTLPPATGDIHITTPPQPVVEEIAAVEVPQAQPAPAPVQAPTLQRTDKYTIVSGDTWYGIAKKHGITVAQLQAANPVDTKKGTIYPGKALAIPVYGTSTSPAAAPAPASTPAKTAAKPAASTAAKIHTVVSGDSLYRIAIKNKINYDTLLRINKIEKKDANNIKIGQKIKLAE